MQDKSKVRVYANIFALICALEAISLNFLTVDSSIFNAFMVIIGLLISALIWQMQYLW